MFSIWKQHPCIVRTRKWFSSRKHNLCPQPQETSGIQGTVHMKSYFACPAWEGNNKQQLKKKWPSNRRSLKITFICIWFLQHSFTLGVHKQSSCTTTTQGLLKYIFSSIWELTPSGCPHLPITKLHFYFFFPMKMKKNQQFKSCHLTSVVFN